MKVIENELYHLNLLEQDIGCGLIKVRYVRYRTEFNEWRSINDITRAK